VIVLDGKRKRTVSMVRGSARRRLRPGSRFALTLAVVAVSFGVLATSAFAAPFGFPSFAARGQNQDGTPSTTAGARPYGVINNFTVSLEAPPAGSQNVPWPAGNLKDVKVELPPGIVGNAALFPHCPQELMDTTGQAGYGACPDNAQVGQVILRLRWNAAGSEQTFVVPVFNMQPPPGVPAQFAFRTLISVAHVNFHVRTGSDYGVTATLHNVNSTSPVLASSLTIWGVPGDPSHDAERQAGVSYPEPPPYRPLLSNPTSCGTPLLTAMSATTWQHPEESVAAAASVAPSIEGCDKVDFDPSVEAQPTTANGESPTGLDFHLHVPQHNTSAGSDEVQALRILADEGQFKVGFGAETSGDLPFNAGAPELRGALEGLPAIGAGNIQVIGGPGKEPLPYSIVFRGALSGMDVEQLTVEDGTEPLEITNGTESLPGSASVSTVTPGTATGSPASEAATANLRDSKVVLPSSLTVNPSSANGLGACSIQQIGFTGLSDEKQVISYDTGVTNSFMVTFGGASTAPIPAAASPSQVTAAIETLPGLNGNVSLDGAPGGWVVTFTGALTGKDVTPLAGVVNDGSHLQLEVTGTGGGFGLESGGVSTAASFETSFAAGAKEFIQIFNATSIPRVGEVVVGPGVAPGTKITQVNDIPGFGTFLNLSKPTTGAQPPAPGEPQVQMQALLPFDSSSAEVQAALESLPAIGAGNVSFGEPSFSGSTRSFPVTPVGALAGTELSLGASSALTGEGAGVAVSTAPPSHALTVATTQRSGAPQFTPEAAQCPDNAKLGTVSISSPAVLDHPLEGFVYLAAQNENPFNSLLAIYITVDDPTSGVVVKLPGKIEADSRTGQLVATVSEAPQLPFEDLHLEFFRGDAAPLKTGIACGTDEVTTDMVPWTTPEGEIRRPGDSFAIDKGCFSGEGAAPNSPSFEAGTVDPSAGKYSPFVLKLSRPDGTQQLTGIDATLPKGLLAKLAGIPYCSDQDLATAAGKSGKAEQSSPSCPAAAQIGTVTVGAGAGGHPFYAPGKVYLSGPYKGAPLSLAVVTPAVAGPFDLGTVVVRTALNVDPITAQVHAVSDSFPHILQGIPLDIRSVVLTLDRSGFTLNPTNCSPQTISGSATALTGQIASLIQRFQVGGCSSLGFGPKLALTLKGQTKRTGNPAVNAVLTAPPGQANIANTTVILPKSSFIDQSHVGNPCTRVQFNENACPAKSVLGTAVAYSPLLEKPLEGPVYFRSNGGERQLPDIVADLNGQIHVVLVGFIDSVKVGKESSRVRTRFASVPDAPVSRFVLKLKGGKRGLIENSENLCKVKPVANVLMTGQNGKPNDFRQKISTSCGTGKKKAKGKRSKQ
jgi:hypothetical protein